MQEKGDRFLMKKRKNETRRRAAAGKVQGKVCDVKRYARKTTGGRYLACSLVLVICVMAVGTAGLAGSLPGETEFEQLPVIADSAGADAEKMEILETGVVEAGDISQRPPEEGETEAESESETETESETGTESESETGTESENETETESETETGNEGEIETGTLGQSETAAQTEPTEQTEKGAQTESVEPAETTVQTESTEQAETSAQTEPVGQIETSEQTELTEQTETLVQTEMPGQMETSEPTEEIESMETTESVESTETTEATEATEATETTEATEATEQTGTAETAEPAESTEPEEPVEPIEPVEPETLPQETEYVPEEVQRGKHYEIEGDPGAWFRDAQDRLWVRPGTNLYVRVSGGGDYSEGTGKYDLREDGKLVFSLKKVDADSRIVRESALSREAYYVDGEAPQAEIAVSGTSENGMVYAAQSSEVSMTIGPDGKSGLKSAAYAVIPCGPDGALQGNPETAAWTVCKNGEQITLREEGTFRVFVRTEDQVGNLAFAQSSPVCIDRRPPEVTIEGVGDQTANSGEVKVRVAVKDAHYKSGSAQMSLVGLNSGKSPAMNDRKETGEGVTLEYFNVPQQKEFDDVYRLQVRAEDLAGNAAEKTLEFSVNRFGSVYDLDQSTRENLKQYFLSKAEDVTFYETNIDYVGESRIFCRRDGALTELKRGQDYQVTMEGSRDSWKQYRYTVPAEYFSKEGVYELLLTSEDSAENKSDTGMQEKRVVFALDWTDPGCTLTGIEQKIYKAEELTARLTPYDNIELKTVRVYLDSELLMEKEGDKLSDQTIAIPLKASKDWQTLQVYLSDMAGNEYWTEELPVFLSPQTKDVPEYVKTRPSAREKAQQEAEKPELPKAEEAAQVEKASTGVKAEPSGVQEKRMADLGAASGTADSGAVGTRSVGLRAAGARMEGMILLILGLVMFAATTLACATTGVRKKK